VSTTTRRHDDRRRRKGEEEKEKATGRPVGGAGLRPALVEVRDLRYKQHIIFHLLVSEIPHLHHRAKRGPDGRCLLFLLSSCFSCPLVLLRSSFFFFLSPVLL
jgi:hypothetical protein